MGQVQLVAGRPRSAASARWSSSVDLADRDAVAVELLEHPADAAKPLVHASASPRRGGAPGSLSPSAGSLPILWTTSIRKPSTPRRSQKRSTSCMASATAGSSQLRSGCSGRNECRYHCPVRLVDASTPAPPAENESPVVRRAVPRSPDVPGRRGLSRPTRDSANHGWRSDVWLGTKSNSTRRPQLVRARDQRVGVVERPEARVDVAVVGDVVAEVGHRRAEERRQPDGLDAEVADVLEPARDPAQVTDAVARRVGERARVDLVDGAPLPPRDIGHRTR